IEAESRRGENTVAFEAHVLSDDVEHTGVGILETRRALIRSSGLHIRDIELESAVADSGTDREPLVHGAGEATAHRVRDLLLFEVACADWHEDFSRPEEDVLSAEALAGGISLRAAEVRELLVLGK